MPAPDWKALAEQVDALIRLAKSYTYVISGIALIGVFFMGKCQGKGEGEADFRDVEAAVSVKLHDSAAKAWKDSASKEKKRGDELERKANHADSVVRDRQKSLQIATDVYRKLADSIHNAPHDTASGKLIVSADSALRIASQTIAAYEAKDVAKDSVITSLKSQRLYLNSAVTEREAQIKSLNTRLEISSKRIGRARREGFAVGAIVGGVAVLSIFAAK